MSATCDHALSIFFFRSITKFVLQGLAPVLPMFTNAMVSGPPESVCLLSPVSLLLFLPALAVLPNCLLTGPIA
jgi:hypothetical protein